MTARPNIVAISADASLEDLREVVINEQYSRIPVFEHNIDQVIGFVHVRDMFEVDEDEREGRTVRELVRPVLFVPETKPVNDLMRQMQHESTHMVIVVDEYGNTAGLATMEDLESTTVGGLVSEWLGRVPKTGEFIDRDGVRIDVLASDDLRVEQVRISKSQTVAHE
jgi:putative hemolysin